LRKVSESNFHWPSRFTELIGPDAIVYSTVTKYLRNDIILQNEPDPEDRAKDQGLSIPDNAILEALEMMPFASIRQIVKMAFIPLTTVFCHLTKSFHFVLKRLRWLPHRLSDLQKQARLIMPKELLKLLGFMRYHSWKQIVTLDEVWFYLSTDHESIWLSPESEAPQRKSHLRR
jgi:hypothetical protein